MSRAFHIECVLGNLEHVREAAVAAVDECFDAIAVLLRMAEMIGKEDANAHNR